MRLSPVGVDMLVKREGVILGAYNDSQGFCTVGIGHLLHRSRCTDAERKQWAGMTRQQAIGLFEQDIATTYGAAVEAAVKVPLTDHQADALISLCFNIGVAGFKGSTVVKRLNARDYEGAATAFMMWNKPAVIVPRRRGEMNQFRTPYGNQQPALVFAGVQAAPVVRGPSTKFANAEWLHPVFRLRLDALFAEVPFTNKSGGRSTQRQAELYRLFKAGKGNPANPPGTSWHEYWPDGSVLAQAADIHPKTGGFAALHAASKKHGIHFPVASEGWHAQPIEAKSSKRTAGQGLGPVPAYWNPATLGEEEILEAIKIEGDTTGALWLRDGMRVKHVGTPQGLTDLRRQGIVAEGPEKVISQRAFDELVKV